MIAPNWMIAGFTLFLAMPPAHSEEIEVFAAASLTDALKEIATGYDQSSGDKLIFNFAASSVLDQQIKAGAPADVFFSADEAKMNDLEKAGLVAKDTRKDLLSNSLVIIVPSDSTVTITAAAQLADPKFKAVALGETKSVPAGIYAKEYLTNVGIWAQVEPRVVPSESVRAALAAVETSNAEAGIVYKTDALHSKKAKIAFEVPVAEGPVITYPAAVVGDSKHAAAAKKFLDYLGTADALKIFEKYGFIRKG